MNIALSENTLHARLGEWDSAGAEAVFYELNGFGYKFYDDKEERDRVWRRQRRAAARGFGPQAIGRIAGTYYSQDAGYPVGSRMYGYITEVADVGLLPGSDIDKLRVLFRETFGVGWRDCRGVNMGRMVDGTPVIIDFGDLSRDIY